MAKLSDMNTSISKEVMKSYKPTISKKGYERMHNIMLTTIGITMLGMLAVSFVPKQAKAADIPNEVVEYAVGTCSVQYAVNISKHAGKSLTDCVTAVAVNVEKHNSLPKSPVRLKWVADAVRSCNANTSVYDKQYCLMLLDAVTRY